jgi:hypothetical protein
LDKQGCWRRRLGKWGGKLRKLGGPELRSRVAEGRKDLRWGMRRIDVRIWVWIGFVCLSFSGGLSHCVAFPRWFGIGP